jgi:hypothetical protein
MKKVIALLALGITACSSPKVVEAPTSPSVAPSPTPSLSAIPVVEKPWRELLPNEDQALRSQLESDEYLAGWFRAQDIWIGYESPEALLEKGFFINAGLNYDGKGKNPPGIEVGSCSLLRQDGRVPAMICGKSATTWQWGIQTEAARSRVWALFNPPEPVRESVVDVADSPANFQWAKVFDPPSNCRSGAGRDFPVQTTYTGVSDVQVDVANPQENSGNWYRESRVNCWIHESQIQFEEPSISKEQVESNFAESNQISTSSSISSSSMSGRCDSPNDRDSAGRRCGKRAASGRRSGRRR